MSVSLKAAIFLCFASLFWSGNFIVGRLSSVEELVSPLSLSFYRWVIALIILTPFCLKNALIDLPLLKKQPGMVFLIILTGFFGHQEFCPPPPSSERAPFIFVYNVLLGLYVQLVAVH